MVNLEELNRRLANLSGTQMDSANRYILLGNVLELFPGYVMLLTSQGKLLRINQFTVQLCRNLQEGIVSTREVHKLGVL